jgi:hypothetical protein
LIPRIVIGRYEAIAHTTKIEGCIGDCFVPANDERTPESRVKAVIARNEAIANKTKVQGCMGDCFVPRNDDRCSDITLQGIDGKGIHPRHFPRFDFFIGTRNDGSVADLEFCHRHDG